jgi:hypothetical protein
MPLRLPLSLFHNKLNYLFIKIWNLDLHASQCEDNRYHQRSICNSCKLYVCRFICGSLLNFKSNVTQYFPNKIVSWRQGRNYFLPPPQGLCDFKAIMSYSIKLALSISRSSYILFSSAYVSLCACQFRDHVFFHSVHIVSPVYLIISYIIN